MTTAVQQRKTTQRTGSRRATRGPSPIGGTVAASHARDMRTDSVYRAAFERASAYEETARAVIALREALGLTQEALADKTGTTASAISRLERGEHSPNLETLRKIAHACGGELRLEFHVPGHRSQELVATL